MNNASYEYSEETNNKIFAWQCEDASRLLLSPEQALKEMELEEFEKKSEEEQKRLWEEQNKELLNKAKKVDEIKDFFSRIIKDNGLKEDEIDFTLKLKSEIASPRKNGIRNDEKGQKSKTLDKTILSQLQQWQLLYQQEFNLDISKDIDNLHIPDKPNDPAQGRPLQQGSGQAGFNWLIIVHKSLKPNQIFNKLQEKFNCYKYRDNLDEITTIADRPDTNIYAIWIRDRVEADEEHRNKSANRIQEEGINSITLEERLLLELWYWRNTKEHLDLNTWTLAAGSRDPLGRVPGVYGDGDVQGLYVYWCDASGAHGDLRCRQAVF